MEDGWGESLKVFKEDFLASLLVCVADGMSLEYLGVAGFLSFFLPPFDIDFSAGGEGRVWKLEG